MEKVGPQEYRVRVKTPPVKGKANKEAMNIIASYFGISPSQVKIEKGLKSKKKLVWVEGCGQDMSKS